MREAERLVILRFACLLVGSARGSQRSTSTDRWGQNCRPTARASKIGLLLVLDTNQGKYWVLCMRSLGALGQRGQAAPLKTTGCGCLSHLESPSPFSPPRLLLFLHLSAFVPPLHHTQTHPTENNLALPLLPQSPIASRPLATARPPPCGSRFAPLPCCSPRLSEL